MPALPYPRRIDMLGHVVSVHVRDEPGNESRNHGGKNESPRARKGASCNAGKSRLMVTRARLANGSDRVHVSRNEEEDGHGAATTDGETEEGELEKVRRGLWVGSRLM
jgi:hypothetical protein